MKKNKTLINKNMKLVKPKTKLVLMQNLEADKVYHLYHLAKLGRISAEVFHDIMNHLTAINLNLQQIQIIKNLSIKQAQNYINKAAKTSIRMQDLIVCIKKTIQQEGVPSNFVIKKEIDSVLKIIAYKIRKRGINIIIKGSNKLTCYGDDVKFKQILCNLFCNGIEAYDKKLNKKNKRLIIDFKCKKNNIIISVKDYGEGISSQNIKKIFQPFFSTKIKDGIGLGLSSVKNIIKKDFKGSISVQSTLNKNTEFVLKIPIKSTSF